MSIQSSINQTLGVAAIATKLSPQLQELGDKVRTSTELNRVERQLKKIASKGQIGYDTKTGETMANIISDKTDFERYQALAAQKRALDQKAGSLGLKTTDWKEFGPEVMGMDEAQTLEVRGLMQRNKVDALKKTQENIRDYQFGGKNYGNDKQ